MYQGANIGQNFEKYKFLPRVKKPGFTEHT